MQMKIGNRNGITLVALVITIVVFMIIISITLNYGVSELHEVTNKKTEAELGIVQEAVMQRYALVQAEHKLGLRVGTDTQPAEFVGTIITSATGDSDLRSFSNVTLKNGYSSNVGLTFEECYYKLGENDLKELNIEKGDNGDTEGTKERQYIVNYFTGEVFDIANKTYYETDINKNNTDKSVYTQPTEVTTSTGNYVFDDN